MTAAGFLRTAIARICYVAGWLWLAYLLVVAGARVLAWDSRSVLVALNALTPVLFIPAWVIGLIAVVRHRWVVVATSGVLAAAHLSFVLPEVMAAEPVPAAAHTAPSIRIFNANVYAFNKDTTGYANEIRRRRPDVIILQESTPRFLASLDSTGALAGLPYRVVISRSDPFAAAVISRWPLRDDDVVWVHDRPILIRATLEFAMRRVRLFAFHAVSPVPGLREEWLTDLDALAATVAAEEGPVLIAGDFNATWAHRAFRRLLDAGLTDAAAARGHPFQMTWPRNRRLLPPLVRIDHILTTDRLVATRIDIGSGAGSDHRSLVADIAVM